MHDIALSELLSSRGFEGASAELALDRLQRSGLTRHGKIRIVEAKLPLAHFVNHVQIDHRLTEDALFNVRFDQSNDRRKSVDFPSPGSRYNSSVGSL